MERKENPYYIGIDLNDKYAMVSFFQLNMNEPETVSTIAGSEVYQIPTVLAKRKGLRQWYYGDDARKMAKNSEMICIDSLLKRAVSGEKIVMDDDTFTAEELMALFIKKVMSIPQKLGNPKDCDKLVITVDKLTKENMNMFWNLLPKLGLTSEQFLVIDHKESFYYFALSQEENLWLHDVYLFEYENETMKYYGLKRDLRTTPQVVSIYESQKAWLSEDKDMDFSRIIQKAFENKIISTVYLVGAGFDGDWRKSSIATLCWGRRAFAGKNLYSKGACYAAKAKDFEDDWAFIYMGENEIKFNLSLKVKDRGNLSFYNLISAGKNWFQTKGECEIIISVTPEIDFWKQLPNSREAKIETLELTDLPSRPDRTTRVRITATPISDDKIEITIKDLGFGEIFRSTDKTWHYEMTM